MRCESNEGGETGRKRGKRFQRMNASTHFLVVFMETTRKLINRMYATPFVCLFASRSVSPSISNGFWPTAQTHLFLKRSLVNG